MSWRVAPPSVLGMLRRLEEQGLLNYARRAGGGAHCTRAACAETLRRRHRLAERLLTDLLGMPWERAHHVACRFEHVIDSEVETICCRPASPHHLPARQPARIPPRGCPLARRCPRSSPVNRRRLRCIKDETAPTLDYLNRLGLRPGRG